MKTLDKFNFIEICPLCNGDKMNEMKCREREKKRQNKHI